MTASAKDITSDPPTLAELAEQTRRSTPPAPPREDSSVEGASIMEGFDERDLRYPFALLGPASGRPSVDSILPAIVDTQTLDEHTPPAPFNLVNERGSSFDFAHHAQSLGAHHLAAVAGLALLSIFTIAAPRLHLPAPAEKAVARQPSTMTPAQAASWAAEPFTVDVPTGRSDEPPAAAPPALREAQPPQLPRFDLEAAAVALAETKSSLSNCETDDEPASARVAVTFSPDGRVASVGIDPASEVDALPACVTGRLRAVRVAPFAGPSVTVRTTVALFPHARD